jgi:excisionase family DNA binding protein
MPRTTTHPITVAPRQRPRQINLTLANPEGILLTVDEAADRLRIGRSKMYELLAEGHIASIHVGRLRRIEPQALLDYVQSQKPA